MLDILYKKKYLKYKFKYLRLIGGSMVNDITVNLKLFLEEKQSSIFDDFINIMIKIIGENNEFSVYKIILETYIDNYKTLSFFVKNNYFKIIKEYLNMLYSSELDIGCKYNLLSDFLREISDREHFATFNANYTDDYENIIFRLSSSMQIIRDENNKIKEKKRENKEFQLKINYTYSFTFKFKKNIFDMSEPFIQAESYMSKLMSLIFTEEEISDFSDLENNLISEILSWIGFKKNVYLYKKIFDLYFLYKSTSIDSTSIDTDFLKKIKELLDFFNTKIYISEEIKESLFLELFDCLENKIHLTFDELIGDIKKRISILDNIANKIELSQNVDCTICISNSPGIWITTCSNPHYMHQECYDHYIASLHQDHKHEHKTIVDGEIIDTTEDVHMDKINCLLCGK